MGYGDLWGFNLTVLIFDKSGLGFMGIYITQGFSINPHITKGPPINPHNP